MSTSGLQILELRRIDPKLYDRRKENGMCTRCGKALTEADKGSRLPYMCDICQTTKARMEKRKAAGLCQICSKVLTHPTEKKIGYCGDCSMKLDIQADEARPYAERREWIDHAVNTFEWFRHIVRGKKHDGMRGECVNCVWRYAATETDSVNFCPTASGTSPATGDCLRYTVLAGRKRRKKKE